MGALLPVGRHISVGRLKAVRPEEGNVGETLLYRWDDREVLGFISVGRHISVGRLEAVRPEEGNVGEPLLYRWDDREMLGFISVGRLKAVRPE